jgi:putative flippase GtrA
MRNKLLDTVDLLSARQILLQWTRFSLVGIKANVIYYLLYMLMTAAGLSAILSVTIIYLLGSVYTFWFTKGFVFRDSNLVKRQFPQYLTVYFIAWGLNIVTLDFMISQMGINHMLAQGTLVCVFAVLIFLTLRFVVFRARDSSKTRGCGPMSPEQQR